jgi:hypothetical protein
MRRDRDLITQAANAFDPGNASETRYLPFLDQLHALGNQGALLGHSYVGRKGIDGAIIYLRNNPGLLRGVISDDLKNLSGKNAINLRIALFYVALAKKTAAGENFGPANLTTFFNNDYFGNNARVKNLLSQTSFYQNGRFYAPDNGYIKNADSSNSVPADFQGLDLGIHSGRNLNNLKMVFTDCSGFAQYVVRQFHPANERLKDRVMSYHLSAVYDALANEKKGTTNGLYDIYGKYNRALKAHEKNKITKFSKTISQLKSVYEPVLNPMQNVRPGDILVERSASASGEGHVMIVVDKDTNNPSRVSIVELTGFGNSRGYKWRDLNLSNDTEGRFHRVLRIKNQ